jgi:hypothetical protein
MPLYTATIKLIAGTEEDYSRLFDELKEKSFRPSYYANNLNNSNSLSPLVLAINQSTMLEVTTSLMSAASHSGKKFSYSVQKEKTS